MRGGATGGGAQGGVAGVLRGLGTAASEVNWRGAGSSSAMRFKKRKRGLRPLGALSHDGRRFADEDVHAKHSGKQLRGWLRGGVRGGGSAPAAEHPPPCRSL